jgi:hypothetical protein
MCLKTKKEWVEYILSNDTSHTIKIKPVDELVREWFISPKYGNYLRLSLEGKEYFDATIKEHYDFSIEPKRNTYLNALAFLAIGKKLGIPFYADYQQNFWIINIRIYDPKIAMTIKLSGGLSDYLKLGN